MSILQTITPKYEYRFCEYNQPVISENFVNIEHRINAPTKNQIWIFYKEWELVTNGNKCTLTLYPFSCFVDGVFIIFGNPDYPEIPIGSFNLDADKSNQFFIGIQYSYEKKPYYLLQANIIVSDKEEDCKLLLAKVNYNPTTNQWTITYNIQSNIHWKTDYFDKIAVIDGNTFYGTHDFTNAVVKFGNFSITPQANTLTFSYTDENGNVTNPLVITKDSIQTYNLQLPALDISLQGNVNPSKKSKIHFIAKNSDYFVFENADIWVEGSLVLQGGLKTQKLLLSPITGDSFESDTQILLVKGIEKPTLTIESVYNSDVILEFKNQTKTYRIALDNTNNQMVLSTPAIRLENQLLRITNEHFQIRFDDDSFYFDDYSIRAKHRFLSLDDSVKLNTQFDEDFKHYFYYNTYMQEVVIDDLKVVKSLTFDSNCKVDLSPVELKVSVVDAPKINTQEIHQIEPDKNNSFAGKVVFQNVCYFEDDVVFENRVVTTNLTYSIWLEAKDYSTLKPGDLVAIDSNGYVIPLDDTHPFLGVVSETSSLYSVESDISKGLLISLSGIVKVDPTQITVKNRMVYANVNNKPIGVMIKEPDEILLLRFPG